MPMTVARISALLCSLAFLTLARAQTPATQTPAAQTPATPPPPELGWKHHLVAGLTLTQVSYTDWVQGGDNALAYTSTLDGKSVNELEASEWTLAYKFAYGQSRLGNQSLRKTDDAIEASLVYKFKVTEEVNPVASATLKTQFDVGYTYDASGNPTPVSKFWDPAYLTQAIGAEYKPLPEVKTRLGVGVREVFTSEFNKYADDPTTAEIETKLIEGGLENVTNLDWKADDNILITSELQLFSPFKHMDEIVVRNTTTFVGKVSKYITANFSLQLINEKNISPRTQIKEAIALGLSYALFE
jgi:hypothetical protein